MANAKENVTEGLQPGDEAPDFTLPRDGGGTLTLSDFQGNPVVLYFYPKNNTSGCTKEAVAFSENRRAFDELGVRVIGVSRDSVTSHDQFKKKHNLNLTLVSDEAGDVMDDYGVWVEKSMYGRKYMGVERTTFLIDADGKIAKVWRKVKVPGHVDAVLKATREIA